MNDNLTWPPLNPKYSFNWMHDDECNHYIVGVWAQHIETKYWAWYQNPRSGIICWNEAAMRKAIVKCLKEEPYKYIISEITVGEIMFEMTQFSSMYFDGPSYDRLVKYGKKVLQGDPSLEDWKDWGELDSPPFRLYKFRPELDYFFTG